MFAPEGTRLILSATFIGLVLAGGGLALGGWGWIFVGLGILVAGSTLWFFRDPERTPPVGADHLLLAPVDGQVIEIADAFEPLYLDGPSKRVSIFLSPYDVHVGRSPATGTVEFTASEPTKAEARRASEPSARSQIGLRHDAGVPILLERITTAAGVRSPLERPVGTRMSAGERLGVVPFGSRMDVAVPPRVVLDVEVGQRTVAGETIIGRLPSSAVGGDGAGIRREATILEAA